MSIAELLGDSRPVLSDGAIGTMLQAAGLMPGTSPEIWNVEHEDRLRVIHTAYADAGAHLLTTNTFGGTRPRLALHGLEDRVHELNEAGARLAREVADASGVLVAGQHGPDRRADGAARPLTHDQVVDLFAEQAAGWPPAARSCCWPRRSATWARCGPPSRARAAPRPTCRWR